MSPVLDDVALDEGGGLGEGSFNDLSTEMWKKFETVKTSANYFQIQIAEKVLGHHLMIFFHEEKLSQFTAYLQAIHFVWIADKFLY